VSDIRFGTKRAHADYGLIVAPYAITLPEPQTNFVDIPGRDGALDLSEAFGTVRYADRIISLTLYARAPFDTLISSFAADVHGRRMNVIFDRDPAYSYDARVTVEDVERHAGFCELSLECRATPYKKEHYETTITVLPTGSATVTLTNARMPVVPTITVSAEMTLTFTLLGKDYTVNLSVGTHIIPSLVLIEGDTEIGITGTGSITFTYRKGAL
jgi:phage-related protein